MKRIDYKLLNDSSAPTIFVLSDLSGLDNERYKREFGIDLEVLKKYTGTLNGFRYCESVEHDDKSREILFWVEVQEIKEYKAIPLSLVTYAHLDR